MIVEDIASLVSGGSVSPKVNFQFLNKILDTTKAGFMTSFVATKPRSTKSAILS